MESIRVRLDWFKIAILPHEGALRARLRRIVNRPCDVDDLVAECMTRAYANGDVTRTTSGKAYLFQIARNLLIDEARREKVVSLELVAELDVLHADHSTEATLHARDELTSLIHDARFRARSGHLLRLAVLRGRPASLAFVSPHSD